MTTSISGTSGVTFNDASVQNTAATGFGFKNRLINSAMVIDQRNAGASVTPTTTGAYVYGPCDRWSVELSQASKFSIQQNAGSVTLPAGFTNYLGITSLSAYSIAAGDYFIVRQAIEGFNIADLAWGTANAKTVTLSFLVYSSLTGTFGGSLCTANQGYSYPFTYSIPVANTWTIISVTVAGPTGGTWATNNGVGVALQLGFGVGSTYSGTAGSWSANTYLSATGATSVVGTSGATFYITGVQLEKGSTATSFDYRPYGTELQLAQRYYYKAITGTAFNQLAFCNIRTTTSHYAFLQIPVTLRANPSSVDYSGIGVVSAWGSGVTGLTSLSFANASYGSGQTQVLLDAVPTSAVGTVGQISMLLGNNSTTGFVALNAEL